MSRNGIIIYFPREDYPEDPDFTKIFTEDIHRYGRKDRKITAVFEDYTRNSLSVRVEDESLPHRVDTYEQLFVEAARDKFPHIFIK